MARGDAYEFQFTCGCRVMLPAGDLTDVVKCPAHAGAAARRVAELAAAQSQIRELERVLAESERQRSEALGELMAIEIRLEMAAAAFAGAGVQVQQLRRALNQPVLPSGAPA